MASPFPSSSSAPGDGHIVAKPLPAGGTGLETLAYQYPLKLISPSAHAAHKSALVFLLSYGGGLVAGDAVRLRVRVLPRARLSLVTQGHTKVFKSPSPDVVTRQTLDVRVDPGAALCLLPDPVQPFEHSVYAQTQVFRVAEDASLCLLDWVTQGRSARGEDWSFVHWTGRNEVWLDASPSDTAAGGRLLLRDSVILSGPASLVLGRPLRDTMHRMGVFGTLILRGPLTESLGSFFLAEFAAMPRIGERDFRSPQAQAEAHTNMSQADRWRHERLAAEKASGLLWSVARIRGCVVVKFGARTVEAGRDWIGAIIGREGSLETHFGSDAVMCLR